MQPDNNMKDSAADWLRHAKSDLLAAKQPLQPGLLLETLCFHTQQATEKAIKAVLVFKDIKFPYTHDLARLITILIDSGIDYPEWMHGAARLTQYAVEARYPGLASDLTENDYKEALFMAEKVIEWASKIIDS